MRRALALVLALLAASSSAESLPRDFRYGLSLFESGDYYRAITEFGRFQFDRAPDSLSEGADWLSAAAYFKGEQWKRAAESYAAFRKRWPKSPRAAAAALFEAESLYEARELKAARAAYESLASQAAPAEAAWAELRLASLDLAERGFELAARRFESLASSEADAAAKIRLARWAVLAREGAALSPPSKTLSVLCSAVLPGSGQMINGHVQDGLSALLMVGGFAAWSTLAALNHNDWAAWGFGIAGGVFYFGNLHGAALAAQREGERAPREKAGELLREIGERPAPEPELAPWIRDQQP